MPMMYCSSPETAPTPAVALSVPGAITHRLRLRDGSQLDLRRRDDPRGLALRDPGQPHGADLPALVLQRPGKGWASDHVPDKPDCRRIEARGNRDGALLLLRAEWHDREVVLYGALEAAVHVAHGRADLGVGVAVDL